MIVITQYAELKLADFLKLISKKHIAWRGVLFRTSQTSFSKDVVKHAGLIRDEIKKCWRDTASGQDSISRLFVFGDGDVLYLAEGIRSEHLTKIEASLLKIFVGKNEVEDKVEHQRYDLSVHWEAMKLFTTGKIHEFEERQEAKKSHHVEKEREIQVDEDYAKMQLNVKNKRKDTHVLIVDDDVATLSLLTNVLKMFTIIKATDGIDAVESYMLNAPDIVFLDINLPSINGIEVLHRIKSFDPNAYVVMLSGQTQLQNVKSSAHEGASGFIAKPFSQEKLFTYIQRYQKGKYQ